jgi:hypothetical protein
MGTTWIQPEAVEDSQQYRLWFQGVSSLLLIARPDTVVVSGNSALEPVSDGLSALSIPEFPGNDKLDTTVSKSNRQHHCIYHQRY